MGFAESSELLLVTSTAGRGVIDCTSGEKLARDRAEWSAADPFEDPYRLEAKGIGPLAGHIIRMSGLYGGGLPCTSRAGWSVNTVWQDDATPVPVLLGPGSWLFGRVGGGVPEYFRLPLGAGELRAVGFSPSGKTLLLATSADVAVWSQCEAEADG